MSQRLQLIPILIVGCILFFSSAWADMGLKLDFERRSVIVHVQGTCPVNKDGDFQQARAMALKNAKNEALELAAQWYAKQYAESKIEPAWPTNPQDVSVLAIVDLGVDQGVYTLQTRAEVPFRLKGRAASESEGPLKLTLDLASGEISKKHGIIMTLAGNRDFFGRLVLLFDDGQAVQLLPNVQRPQELFRVGKSYSIPSDQDSFSLTPSDGEKEDVLVVLAASSPLGPVDFAPMNNGLLLMPEGLGALLQQSRHGILYDISTTRPGGVEIYEAHWRIAATEAVASGLSKVKSASRGVRLEDPEGPIDMTGTAGAYEPLKLPGSQ